MRHKLVFSAIVRFPNISFSYYRWVKIECGDYLFFDTHALLSCNLQHPTTPAWLLVKPWAGTLARAKQKRWIRSGVNRMINYELCYTSQHNGCRETNHREAPCLMRRLVTIRLQCIQSKRFHIKIDYETFDDKYHRTTDHETLVWHNTNLPSQCLAWKHDSNTASPKSPQILIDSSKIWSHTVWLKSLVNKGKLLQVQEVWYCKTWC